MIHVQIPPFQNRIDPEGRKIGFGLACDQWGRIDKKVPTASFSINRRNEMAKNKKWGVVPYREKEDGTIDILVVSTAKDNWILPKGNLIKRIGKKRTALREAFEEAGVLGKITDKKGETYEGKEETLHLYPMKVKTLLAVWPEQTKRKRRWIRPEKAGRWIKRKSMQRAVLALKT